VHFFSRLQSFLALDLMLSPFRRLMEIIGRMMDEHVTMPRPVTVRMPTSWPCTVFALTVHTPGGGAATAAFALVAGPIMSTALNGNTLSRVKILVLNMATPYALNFFVWNFVTFLPELVIH
jgi:hypothetical protein